MPVEIKSGTARMAEFVVGATVPLDARARAAAAFRDTMGVILAGAMEPAARMVRQIAVEDGHGECRILGTRECTSSDQAALANGVSAHALDYDDMCFVSLAHPSCVLVPAALAAAEMAHSPGHT